MSNAALHDQNAPPRLFSTQELTPAPAATSTKLSGSGQFSPQLLHVCAQIAAAWRRHGFTDAEARHQADQFAQRFIGAQYAAELAALAAVMAAS